MQRSALTLGFYGDDLDPAELTARLGREPTVGVTKGGTWFTSQGAPKIAPTGSWRIKASSSEPADLDTRLESILETMTDDLGIWRDLTARFDGRIFCGLFLTAGNEGVAFNARSIAAMAARGLYLALDIYSGDPEA